MLFIIILFPQSMKNPKKLIVGTWENEYGEEITFYKNGTMDLEGIPATYSIDDDNTLHIKGLGLFEAATLEWSGRAHLYSAGAGVDDGEWYISGSELKLEEDIYIKE